ncbi:MAG: FAD-dependent thymidylate synthase [Bacillota bacterium]|nr:FAD-dependent thymidylate synthase [Bacillota bacterium]
MKVELLTHTPEPEATVAAAARLCYTARCAGELKENLSRAEVDSLLRKLVAVGHLSPAEHASFTFAIEGVSRALSHQLVRHRIASYSQKSQRYVDERDFAYITPPSIAADPGALALFREKMEELQAAYRELSKKVPREDARYLLPNAVETKLVCTFNARSLFNFFRLRCCRRAQWEIRALALKMREEVRRVAPVLFALAGPPCETEGICWEGEFSCGGAQEVRYREVPDDGRHDLGA